MKAHLIKDAEDHSKVQGQLNNLEEEKRVLKQKYERLQENQDIYQQGGISIIELPQKQRALIKVIPKVDN